MPDPQRIQAVFLAAVEQPPAERKSFLDQECGSDAQLRRRVEELLEAHDAPGSFLDATAAALSPTLSQPVAEGPGTQIGPYKLLQQIGEGGFGVVFMAEQTEPVERRVALKIIKPGMDTKQVIARFEAERQALALMDHPNIAKVLDAGATDSGRPYFVMELVKGVPITRYCDEHQLTPRERLELFVAVCQAVQHAHQKGIIHRDIKPSNVLVARYDDRSVPKVIDFGVAKATSHRLTQKTMFTQFGQLVGTPEYMSPEQAQLNQLDIDTRSDIYSLGVLLYELLAGETPFDRQRLRSAAFDELLRIIREEEPPRPSTRLSNSSTLPSIAAHRHTEPRKLSALLRGELDWIVMKALEKDRGRRYETASSFGRDVEHYLKDEPVIACPPSAGYRFRKFAQRNQRALATASVVAAALLIGTAVATWQAVQATQARNRAVAAEALANERLSRALKAEELARKEAQRANVESEEARTQAAIAQAVNDFLNEDLLSQAAPDNEPDRDITLREVLDRAAESVERRFADQPLVEAPIRVTVARTYLSLGMYGKAEEHYRRATQLYEETRGHEDPLTMLAKRSLGHAIDRQERYAESEKIICEVLEEQRRVLGAEHPITLSTIALHAWQICRHGRYAEAEELLREVLEIQQRVLGPEHRSTLSTMLSLAHAIGCQDRETEALELSRRTLEIQRRVLGPEHPAALTLMYNMTNGLRKQERYTEAEQLLREALDAQRRVLGPEHPRTLASMGRLALVLDAQGRHREEAEVWRELAEIREKLAKRNPESAAAELDVVRTYFALADAQRFSGEASRLTYEKIVARLQATPQEKRNAAHWGYLGRALYRLDRLEEAREALETGIRSRRETAPTLAHGPRWWYLTMTLARLGETEKARQFFDRLLPEMQKSEIADEVNQLLRDETAQLLGLREEDDSRRTAAESKPKAEGILTVEKD